MVNLTFSSHDGKNTLDLGPFSWVAILPNRVMARIGGKDVTLANRDAYSQWSVCGLEDDAVTWSMVSVSAAPELLFADDDDYTPDWIDDTIPDPETGDEQ